MDTNRDTTRLETWLGHGGGVLVFLALFAGLYVLAAGVSLGLNILQALLVDLAFLISGISAMTWVALRRVMRRARAVRHYRTCSFAVRPATEPVAVAPMQKARTVSRPGLRGGVPEMFPA